MTRKEIIRLLFIGIILGFIFFTFFTDEKTPKMLFLNIGISLLYTILIGFGNGYANNFLNKKYSWAEQTKQRTIWGIIVVVLVNVLMVLICNYINFIIIQKENPTNFWNGNMNFRHWLFINISLLITTFYHAKGFMEEWKKSTKKEVVEQKIIAKSANAQFESLKNQLDPHFLFNSLNVLDSLIEENPEQAQRFTNSMSKIYRYVLDQKDKELVTVQEEIDFAIVYCELLKTRFEDSVHFNFDVEEKVKNFFVVPLSLQLLLENSIKHNYATSKKPLIIKIYSENNFLIIQNNLQAREVIKAREGIGLSNIVQRYSLLTKENVYIEKSEDYFKVKIPIINQKKEATTFTTIEEKNIAYENAVRKVKELKSFYASLISFSVIIPFLIFINIRTSSYQWFWFPLLGWGMGLVIQGFKIFIMGKDWEEKKIKQIMDKNK